MKKYICIMMAGAALLAASCNKEEDAVKGFSVDRDEIFANSEGGVEIVRIESQHEWLAYCTEPWVMISPANGIGRTDVSIAIDTTLLRQSAGDEPEREALVSFYVDDDLKKQITVTQYSYSNIIKVCEPEVSIDYFKQVSERTFSAKVVSNIDFDCVVEYEDESTGTGWINKVKFTPNIDRSNRPRTTVVKVDWNISLESEQRTARISFVPKNGGTLDDEAVAAKVNVLTVTQKAAPKIEDNRAGDSLVVVLVNSMMDTMNGDDLSENMRNWDNVALWGRLDKDIQDGNVPEDAIGRVRAVRFYMFNTNESVPELVGRLKYLQTLDFYSNVNNGLKNITLGSEIAGLEYLKYLEIGAYGLTRLGDGTNGTGSFARFGDNRLNTLDFNSNSLDEIPSCLTPANFPRLKALNLATNRRVASLTDLRKAGEYESRGGIAGLYKSGRYNGGSVENEGLKKLLLWDSLEELSLSYNCLEGSLPDFSDEGAWTEEECHKIYKGDTLKFLWDAAYRAERLQASAELRAIFGATDQDIPMILPKASIIKLNLNFFTGALPKWLLFHPRLMEMDPETLIFNQQERGINSRGELAGFSNTPTSFGYYFAAFPMLEEKFTYNDVYED